MKGSTNMTLLRASGFKEMAWKNGNGVTREIALMPPTARFPEGPFLWRLSSATVGADGPFSLFPGYRRWLTVLSGEGLKLNDRALREFEMIEFSGDEPIQAKLLDRAVVDLGLIFDPRQIELHARCLRETCLELGRGLHLLYVAQGGLTAGEVSLSTGDALRIEDAVELPAPLTISSGAVVFDLGLTSPVSG